MNEPIDWSSQDRTSDEAWRNYFNLLLQGINDIMTAEFTDLSVYPYDDPKDFVNGFTLAGAFFSGLHMEQNPMIRQAQVSSFRKSLAMYIIDVINRLERDEKGV